MLRETRTTVKSRTPTAAEYLQRVEESHCYDGQLLFSLNAFLFICQNQITQDEPNQK